jgi:hypothetical protein
MSALVSYNKNMAPAVRSSKSARAYLAQWPTRFAYNRDLLEVTGRNFYTLRDVLEKTPGVSRPLSAPRVAQQNTRWESL